MNAAAKNVLILGASRGLGRRLWELFSDEGFNVTAVARRMADNPAPAGRFIRADFTSSVDVNDICTLVSPEVFSIIIYVAGIWEQGVFAAVSHEDISNIVTTNLTTPLHIAQALLKKQIKTRCNFILIGSTCGLENEGSRSVAYVSSKFGLRGIAHAMREASRGYPLYVTCISPGSLDTGQGEPESVDKIPESDLYKLIRCLAELSPSAVVKELCVPAFNDLDV